MTNETCPLVDMDVVEAAVSYVKYGMHPGGCCEQILLGSLEEAAKRCHPVALECFPSTYEAVRKIVPVEARDSAEAIARWIEHGGLSGKAKAMLSIKEHSKSGYGPRTFHNAKVADLTVAFAVDFGTAGEVLTHKAAGDKYVDICLDAAVIGAARELYAALKSNNVKVLNVAGNGIYTLHKHGWNQRNINDYVYAVLEQVYKHWPFKIVSGGQTGADLAGAVAGVVLGADVAMTMPKGFRQRHEDKIDRTHTHDEILEQVNTYAADIKDAHESHFNHRKQS